MRWRVWPGSRSTPLPSDDGGEEAVVVVNVVGASSSLVTVPVAGVFISASIRTSRMNFWGGEEREGGGGGCAGAANAASSFWADAGAVATAVPTSEAAAVAGWSTTSWLAHSVQLKVSPT